jgi:hypothetical protein
VLTGITALVGFVLFVSDADSKPYINIVGAVPLQSTNDSSRQFR